MSDYTAAVLEKQGENLQLKSLPALEAITGSAVVKMLAASISGNSKAVFGGAFPVPLRTPVTPSSTAIGRIHAVGSDATKLKPGQLVWIDLCVHSRDDDDTSILQGYMGGSEPLESTWANGSYAEYSRFPLEKVYALNEEVLVGKFGYKFADLAFLGTLAVPMGGLLDIETRPGDIVIVAPATGYFGGAAAHAALSLGAKVIACGRNEARLSKMAETFNSTGRFTTVRMTSDVEKDTAAIKTASGSDKGANRYIDFTPPRAAESKHMVACLQALRPNGRATIMGAVFGEVGIPYFWCVRNNIRIQGRYMFDNWHVEQVLRLVESGNLRLGSGENSGVHVDSFKLQDITQALDEAEKKNNWGNMVVIEP